MNILTKAKKCKKNQNMKKRTEETEYETEVVFKVWIEIVWVNKFVNISIKYAVIGLSWTKDIHTSKIIKYFFV